MGGSASEGGCVLFQACLWDGTGSTGGGAMVSLSGRSVSFSGSFEMPPSENLDLRGDILGFWVEIEEH